MQPDLNSGQGKIWALANRTTSTHSVRVHLKTHVLNEHIHTDTQFKVLDYPWRPSIERRAVIQGREKTRKPPVMLPQKGTVPMIT